MFEIRGKYARADVFADQVEETCLGQITKMVNHPAFDLGGSEEKHIAIMPDTHAGKGSVIGFTMPLQRRVVANVVGVDIGCGMSGSKFIPAGTLDLPEVDKRIREAVPLGHEVNEKSQHSLYEFHNGGPKSIFFSYLQTYARVVWGFLVRGGHSKEAAKPPLFNIEWYEQLCDRVGMKFGRAQASVGSLGGGNHFIEVGINDDGHYWVIVHSGSRQLGEKVCRYWQRLASQRRAEKVGAEYEAAVRSIRDRTKDRSQIPKRIKELRQRMGVYGGPKELDFLEGDDFYGYIWDMYFAQQYASANRGTIMAECMNVLCPTFPTGPQVLEMGTTYAETVHNYIDYDDLVIRKGAVRAHKDETFILPFNMRDGTLICKGLGNKDWNQSAPHGAGRLLPRGVAKRTLDATEAEKQMEGIYTSMIPLDEAPGAYKPAQAIEEAIAPTAKIVERIKPVLNIKAG